MLGPVFPLSNPSHPSSHRRRASRTLPFWLRTDRTCRMPLLPWKPSRLLEMMSSIPSLPLEPSPKRLRDSFPTPLQNSERKKPSFPPTLLILVMNLWGLLRSAWGWRALVIRLWSFRRLEMSMLPLVNWSRDWERGDTPDLRRLITWFSRDQWWVHV